MEKLLEGIGSLPPALLAITVVALAIIALVYAWRKAGIEAKAERARAQNARDDGQAARFDEVLRAIEGVADVAAEIKTGVEVLKDRGRGK